METKSKLFYTTVISRILCICEGFVGGVFSSIICPFKHLCPAPSRKVAAASSMVSMWAGGAQDMTKGQILYISWAKSPPIAWALDQLFEHITNTFGKNSADLGRLAA